jgi:hypothetical protein
MSHPIFNLHVKGELPCMQFDFTIYAPINVNPEGGGGVPYNAIIKIWCRISLHEHSRI